jgi:prepilin-type N-terminal cleavage/methylation domain-containing protein
MKTKGFTLLELLLVITLLGIFFGLVSLIYISNIKAGLDLSLQANQQIQILSIYNQLRKQFVAKYPKGKIDIYITDDRISFYTLYPVFFFGAVRVEYYIKRVDDKYLLIYEEFPFVDGKLGNRGLKKMILGKFNNVKLEAYDNRNTKITNYKGNKFPKYIKLQIEGKELYIY